MKSNMNILSVITLERVDLARVNYAMGISRNLYEESFEALNIVGKGAPLIKSFLGDDFNEMTAQNLDIIDEMKSGDRLHFIVEKDGQAKKFTLTCLSTGNIKFPPEFYCPDLYNA